MSKALQQAVQEALGAMRTDSRHELAPDYRRAIYEAFGPPVEEPVPDRGRGMLAIFTARYVLHLFEQYRIYDDTRASELIAIGENVINGKAPFSDAVTLLHIVKAGQWPDPEMHPAGRAAGRAALRAIDEVLGYNGLNYDYDGIDTAMIAASAACGGWALPHQKEPKKLQEFWEWWLLEAIPAAWNAAQAGTL